MDTDLSLRQDVLDELEFEPRLDAAAIGVSVNNGIVTLTGHVKSYAEKIEAERAVGRVKGVRGIAEEIEVRLPSTIRHDDEEIARRAANILSWNVYPRLSDTKVRVEHGRVTVEGKAEGYAQKMDAERQICRLEGVIGVTNLIHVKPRVSPTDIRAQIESAFRRNAELEASNIHVNVDGSKIILTGKVKAFYEREMAERAAWAAQGVTAVEDRLQIGA